MITKNLRYVPKSSALRPTLSAFQNSGLVNPIGGVSPASQEMLLKSISYTNNSLSPYNSMSYGMPPINQVSNLQTMQNQGTVEGEEDEFDYEEDLDEFDEEYKNYLNDLAIYVQQFGEESLRDYPPQYMDYIKYKEYMSTTDPNVLLKQIEIKAERLKTKNPLKSFISNNQSPTYNFKVTEDNPLKLNIFDFDNPLEAMASIKDLFGEGKKANLTPIGVSKSFEPMGVFKNGGSVVSPSYSRYLPVGNFKKITGYLPMDSMIPIQTEEGELIVHPTLDVTKVNATKRHNKMKDDEVTDIAPEGSYILSRHGVVRIYKDEADKRVIETQNSPYNMYSTNKPPTVKTLGDFMSKKEMSPAEVANSVLKKYKTVDHNDPFTDQTNSSNKYTASKYIRAIVDLSEFDKSRKGIAGGQDMSQMYQMNPESIAKNGGNIYRRQGIKRHQVGDVVGAAAGIGADIWKDWKARQDAKRLEQAAYEDALRYGTGTRDLVGKRTLAGLAAVAASDPYVDYAKRGSQFVEGILGNVNARQNERAFASQLASTAPDFSMYDPRVAGALGSQAYGQRLNALSGYSQGQAQNRQDLLNKYQTMMQSIQDANEASRIAAVNQMRGNRNQMINQSGELGMDYYGSLADVLRNEIAIRAAGRNQYLSNMADINKQLADNLSRNIKSLPWDEWFKKK